MLRCPLWAFVLCLRLACPAWAASPPPAVGTNLDSLDYWNTETPFRDAFKTSGAWLSGTAETWDDGRKLDLDARGWVRKLAPGQAANMVLYSDTSKFSGTLPTRYIVRYRGSGTLEYNELARLVDRGSHRDLIELTSGTGNATITLTATDQADPLRDVTIKPEDSRAGQLFNPAFLDGLKGYRALRFMTWMLGHTSQFVQSRWRDRPLPNDARWDLKGAPIETMTALANETGKDPWFTIPHAADDDYVRRFAQTIKRSLDPELKVYLEYSNEVWNPDYPQFAYAAKKGQALGLGDDPRSALVRYQAKRSVEIFKIWERVLGKERLVRVFGTQSGGPDVSEIALTFEDTKKHLDALATAPYFGYYLTEDDAAAAKTAGMSLDELMRELETVALPKAKAEMQEQAAIAKKYGLPLIAYEGGQHLVDFRADEKHDPALDALYDAANRDPRMGKIYSRYLADWADSGGGLFMHHLDCGPFGIHGRWGAKEYLAQPRSKAPKFDALQRFSEGR